MRTRALGLCLTTLLLTAACGQDDTATSPTATTAAPTSSAPPSPATPVAGGTQLRGTVGEQGEPDAFTITLTDASGQPVSTLPAGDYTIVVDDLSTIHNFHLQGGSVDESTSVPEVGQQTFQVSLTAGTYTYVCDPHPRMAGGLTVT